jgi:phosphoribosylanthranilate isomerase
VASIIDRQRRAGHVDNGVLSRWIRDAVCRVSPFLAGGSHADNVADAIAPVYPFGVDRPLGELVE